MGRRMLCAQLGMVVGTQGILICIIKKRRGSLTGNLLGTVPLDEHTEAMVSRELRLYILLAMGLGNV